MRIWHGAIRLSWHKRQFRSGDTEGMFLVCAATDLPKINTQVFKEAHEVYGINLVNVVDVIPECTFAAASVITHEDLTISISTSGKSPAVSRRIREYLEAKFGAISLYDEPSETNFTPSLQGQWTSVSGLFLVGESPLCRDQRFGGDEGAFCTKIRPIAALRRIC